MDISKLHTVLKCILNKLSLLFFRYRCEHCTFESEKRRVIFEHIRSFHVNTADICKCDLCPFETMYKCNLVSHVKKMHNDVEKRMEVISSTTQKNNSNSPLKIDKSDQEDKLNVQNSSCDTTLCDMI